MAPRSVDEAGEMQTQTIVGIVLGLMCFFCLVLSIWALSYCFPRRKQTSPPSCLRIDLVVEDSALHRKNFRHERRRAESISISTRSPYGTSPCTCTRPRRIREAWDGSPMPTC
ncbi:hypothetical protein EDD15DRAFT_2195711 [Pisolithus albus]|nr:hypothetical protein EDD15DRAFT_2195711 [Pisolithus albus]